MFKSTFAAILIAATGCTRPAAPAEGTGDEQPTATAQQTGGLQATYSWPEIERQIQWHRDRVRWCGPLSAVRTLRLLGHEVDVEATLEPFRGGDPRGTSVEQVLTLCQQYRPRARLVRLAGKQPGRLDTPCILFVNEGRHALVLQSLSRGQGTAEIWDPADLQVKTLTLAQMQRLWTGDAIVLHGAPWPSFALGTVNAIIVVQWLVRQWRRRVSARRHMPPPNSS
jgi:ABC-type bacteriocin/lantibiotic exporter with double-glycine peptidase domain